MTREYVCTSGAEWTSGKGNASKVQEGEGNTGRRGAVMEGRGEPGREPLSQNQDAHKPSCSLNTKRAWRNKTAKHTKTGKKGK